MILAAAIVIGALTYFHEPSYSDQHDRLIAELRGFPEFAAHETLLLELVDQAHDEAARRYLRRRRTTRSVGKGNIRWENYRSHMYRRLVNGLTESGHAEVAIRLEQYRARH